MKFSIYLNRRVFVMDQDLCCPLYRIIGSTVEHNEVYQSSMIGVKG